MLALLCGWVNRSQDLLGGCVVPACSLGCLLLLSRFCAIMAPKRFGVIMRGRLLSFCVVALCLSASPILAAEAPKKSPAASELTEGWIVALAARPKGDAAREKAYELAKKGVPNPKILWMGDYKSFGEKDFWLVYYGPMPRADKKGAKAQLKILKALVPDAYALLMSKTEKRQVLK